MFFFQAVSHSISYFIYLLSRHHSISAFIYLPSQQSLNLSIYLSSKPPVPQSMNLFIFQSQSLLLLYHKASSHSIFETVLSLYSLSPFSVGKPQNLNMFLYIFLLLGSYNIENWIWICWWIFIWPGLELLPLCSACCRALSSSLESSGLLGCPSTADMP